MKTSRRLFGPGAEVSLFTLGTMRALDSPQQMYEVVKAAFLSGINHLETAPSYGSAETYLGEALKRLEEEGLCPKNYWVLTSKIQPGIQFKEGKVLIKRMLSRLNVPKINNLGVHGINVSEHLNWALKNEGVDLLKWAEEEGLINQVGFSSHGSTSLIRKAIESRRFNFCSLHLHLLDQERIPLANLALKKGLGVMAISPADKGGRLQAPSKTLVEDCHPIPPIELAYKFLLSKGISTLTVGASHPKDLSLAKRLSCSIGHLTKEENYLILRLKEKMKERLGETFCGQCKACMPCPSDVPISNLLKLRNLNIGHDLQAYTKERYNLIDRAGHWWETVNASSCNSCGECLPKCPNHLRIPELLEDTHFRLKDSPKRRLWS